MLDGAPVAESVESVGILSLLFVTTCARSKTVDLHRFACGCLCYGERRLALLRPA